MGDETGIRTRIDTTGAPNSGQPRPRSGGASGDASGIRTVPDPARVGQESGGEQQMKVPAARKDADISSERGRGSR